MGLEADGSAAIWQRTGATEALTGSALTRAVSSRGDRANTSVNATMNSGRFNSTMGVLSKDENVSIYHKADASSALGGNSDALAQDESGNLAQTSVNATMANGLFDTVMGLEADGSAAIWQETNAMLAISGQALTFGLSKEGKEPIRAFRLQWTRATSTILCWCMLRMIGCPIITNSTPLKY
jgi:hypothetical protein